MVGIAVENSLKTMKSVFITGVSSGIGEELAKYYLKKGYLVCGVSRRYPTSLMQYDNMHFMQVDLRDFNSIGPAVSKLYKKVDGAVLETIFLNAGTFGKAPSKSADISINDFIDVISLNLFAVKVTLDECIRIGFKPTNVVASASISSLRQRAGMSSYATSKAALNALIKTYQLENYGIHFLSLGLCNVDTLVAETILDVSSDFPELFKLKQRAQQKGYLTSPKSRAKNIADVIDQLAELDLKNGDFYEIRDLLPMLNAV